MHQLAALERWNFYSSSFPGNSSKYCQGEGTWISRLNNVFSEMTASQKSTVAEPMSLSSVWCLHHKRKITWVQTHLSQPAQSTLLAEGSQLLRSIEELQSLLSHTGEGWGKFTVTTPCTVFLLRGRKSNALRKQHLRVIPSEPQENTLPSGPAKGLSELPVCAKSGWDKVYMDRQQSLRNFNHSHISFYFIGVVFCVGWFGPPIILYCII